jgi:histone-lysine N-methyltransferase SUV39H
MPRLEDKADANGFDDDDDEMTGEEKLTKEEVEKADIMSKYQAHCDMHERHFYCHMLKNPDFAEEEKRCHYCQIRSFKTDATAKTSMVNHVKGDYHVIDANFVFIESSIVREGVEEPDDAALSGCSCTTRLECMKDSCSCLTEVVPPEEATDNSKINAYHGTGYLKGCLRRYWLENNLPIYECSDKCSCDESCANRVVGRGRETSLQVFRTRDGRGWGTSIQFTSPCNTMLTYVQD